MTDTPMKDFTRKRERLLFRIDDDVFEAAGALPGRILAKFAARFAVEGGDGPEEQLDAVADALGLVLLPESNELFQKRLGDLENPISLDQAGQVIEWLMEKYGLREDEQPAPAPEVQPQPVSAPEQG